MAIAERIASDMIRAELENIRQTHNGILHPHDVVDYASNPDTALYHQFEWDDRKASHAYRLWQARQIIRAVITILPDRDEGPIEAYISLKSDRYDDGGYRAIVDVLSDQDLRKQLLQDAMRDFELWERKYKQIVELVPIFKAAKKVKRKV